ncbi:MAG TPA: ATP cone domain-containing protein [Candidatus Saccharibacteria bacterium]|jgi:transcriptional regulator NrdR family protein|nr:ATP cone domain-containing protein [Candidatus Saccharibacteria bacterium]HMT56275.1 ATP cone domain-containing protein [Candidatus Saccharibacteria bacterium]
MQHIVKRAGHKEPYDERKLYASIFSACQSVREPEGSAELIAEKVARDMAEWIKTKYVVTSNDIRHQAALHLHVYHPDAAYMYLHHRVIW